VFFSYKCPMSGRPSTVKSDTKSSRRGGSAMERKGKRGMRTGKHKFHDQGDATWIVFRGQLRGHYDTPYRLPGGWPPSGRIWWFRLLLFSNILFLNIVHLIMKFTTKCAKNGIDFGYCILDPAQPYPFYALRAAIPRHRPTPSILCPSGGHP
jgi:hypothetical protein